MSAPERTLAQVMAQARHEGADLPTLRAVAEEASEAGATRALDRLGLSDAGAGDDVRELRLLLRGWRDAKRQVFQMAVGWVLRLAVALALAAIAVRLGEGGR